MNLIGFLAIAPRVRTHTPMYWLQNSLLRGSPSRAYMRGRTVQNVHLSKQSGDVVDGLHNLLKAFPSLPQLFA